MTSSLQQLVAALELHRTELEKQRFSTDFANDVFEAVDDLGHLGRYILDGDTRINYPVRVEQEQQLWKTLVTLLRKRSLQDQRRYANIFETAEEILRIAQKVGTPKDGHLGFVRIISKHFAFLAEFGFKITREEPTAIRFCTNEVYIDLRLAQNHSSSCAFGPASAPNSRFWIDDLLFMRNDQRYRTVPQELMLDTESAVENWFAFLAGIFKQYGKDILTNEPGIFDRLAKAQEQRDLEYKQEMDRRYAQ